MGIREGIEEQCTSSMVLDETKDNVNWFLDNIKEEEYTLVISNEDDEVEVLGNDYRWLWEHNTLYISNENKIITIVFNGEIIEYDDYSIKVGNITLNAM